MIVIRYDGSVVICIHDGAPCPRCQTPEQDWPAIWRTGWTLVQEPAEEGP